MLAKGGNGLDMGGLTYWNPEMDGNVNVKWDSKFLTCITTVYGVANWSPNDISVPLISTPFASHEILEVNCIIIITATSQWIFCQK